MQINIIFGCDGQICSLFSVKHSAEIASAPLPLQAMRRFSFIVILLFAAVLLASTADAQCSVCTKTALQLGEKPAQGMNSAILYLMMMPFAVVGFIGYRWWKGNKKLEEQENNTIV